MERMSNCPNCGSIIDESGRCQHCGSKLYDLFDVDVTHGAGHKFIRIKTDRGIVVAPVVYKTVSITNQIDACCYDTYDGRYLHPIRPILEMSIDLSVIGEMIYEGDGS